MKTNYSDEELERGDHDFDRLNDEGHDKWCDKWMSTALDCSCSVRLRDVEDYSEYEEPPVRKSKSEKPKMGRDGDSVKLISKIIGGKGKKR
jgi:hypothetical protein